MDGSPPLAAAAVCAVAVVALLGAERRQWRPGLWAAKIAASTAFVVAAWLWGAWESPYGRLVLVALALSWLGDVLLIPRERRSFLAGLGAFLLAHVTFAVAFAQRPQNAGTLAAGSAAMVGFGLVVLRWLWPRLDRRMRPPVVCYVAAITAMVALACGAAPAAGAALAVGAAGFAVSDVFVARHRFVTPSFVNKLLGLPLYYAAQLVLAATVAPRGSVAALLR